MGPRNGLFWAHPGPSEGAERTNLVRPLALRGNEMGIRPLLVRAPVPVLQAPMWGLLMGRSPYNGRMILTTFLISRGGRFDMLDSKQIDDLVHRLASAMPKGIQALQEDINRNLRASLESGLARLDLVTREEFDVQSAVLARSREKLAALETRIAELEQALASRHAGAD